MQSHVPDTSICGENFVKQTACIQQNATALAHEAQYLQENFEKYFANLSDEQLQNSYQFAEFQQLIYQTERKIRTLFHRLCIACAPNLSDNMMVKNIESAHNQSLHNNNTASLNDIEICLHPDNAVMIKVPTTFAKLQMNQYRKQEITYYPPFNPDDFAQKIKTNIWNLNISPEQFREKTVQFLYVYDLQTCKIPDNDNHLIKYLLDAITSCTIGGDEAVLCSIFSSAVQTDAIPAAVYMTMLPGKQRILPENEIIDFWKHHNNTSIL